MGFVFDPTQMSQEDVNQALAGARPEVPEGLYRCYIKGAEDKPYQDNQAGRQVDATIIDMEVLEGAQAGSQISEFLTPNHPNANRAKGTQNQLVRMAKSLFGEVRGFSSAEIIGKTVFVKRDKRQSKGKTFYNNFFISETAFKNGGEEPLPNQGGGFQAPQGAPQQPRPQPQQGYQQPAYNAQQAAPQQAAPQQAAPQYQQAPQQAPQQAHQGAPQQGYQQPQQQAPQQGYQQPATQDSDVPF